MHGVRRCLVRHQIIQQVLCVLALALGTGSLEAQQVYDWQKCDTCFKGASMVMGYGVGSFIRLTTSSIRFPGVICKASAIPRIIGSDGARIPRSSRLM